MQVRQMTPQQIDTVLAELYAEADTARQFTGGALDNLHYALDERRRPARRGGRSQWPTTHAQAIVKLIAAAAEDDPAAVSDGWRQAPLKALDRLDCARNRVRHLTAQMAPYHAEFTRRGGWSRFFTVTGGHIHSSLNCQTCHRDGKVTDIGWTPQLSGRTEAEAMAELGRQSFVLCTVCYPHAPLEWTVKAETPSCPGSRKAPAAKTEKRTGNSFYGRCTGCNGRHRVTMYGQIVKHPPVAVPAG